MTLEVNLLTDSWVVSLPRKSFGHFTIPKSLREKYSLRDKDLCPIEIRAARFKYIQIFKLTSGGEIYIPRSIARRIGESLTSSSKGVTCTLRIRKEAQDDTAFFNTASDEPTVNGFVFRAGHKRKKIGQVQVIGSKSYEANLLHNQLQDILYERLVSIYGSDNVGTENITGHGTAIDVVVKSFDSFEFYEIKTADSVKASIRQALPQLLEYAFWPPKVTKVEKLVIASQMQITKQGNEYLQYLRTRFKLPFYYMQIE